MFPLPKLKQALKLTGTTDLKKIVTYIYRHTITLLNLKQSVRPNFRDARSTRR